MYITTVMGYVAVALQFIVAAYALRLNRLFGTKRVGWSLFWAFLLLALLHLMPSATKGSFGAEAGIKVDVMNAVISLLLLIGMVHLEAMLKERTRAEREEKRMRVELEEEVQKKTSYLMRAIEQLEAEMDERKRVESEAESTQWELSAVSRQAEMAQIASKVLQTVGDMLNSVNISADLVSDQVKQSKIANLVRVGVTIRDHGENIGEFMTQDPRGQKLPDYIRQLAEHLSMEQIALLTQLEIIKENLQKITLMQQDYCKLAIQAHKENGPDAAPEAQREAPAATTA